MPGKKTGKKPTRKPRAKPGVQRKKGRATAMPGGVYKSNVSRVAVSECTQRFAEALSNPWSERALGACLPIEPVRPSMKVCVKQRISTTIGTNGGCFIVISPCIANNLAFAWYSSSGYQQSDSATFTITSTNTTTTPGVQAQVLGGLPFSSTQLGLPENRMSARIVSVGVRAQYTGTTLNEAGTWNGLIAPDGSDMTQNVNSIPNISNVPGFKWRRVTKQPITMVTGPLDHEGYEWCRPDAKEAGTQADLQTACYPWATEGIIGSPSTALNGQCPIFLMLTGGVLGQGVVFEVIAHIEYSGKLCYAMTPSHNDEVAAKAVLTSATKVNQSSSWRPDVGQLTSGLAEVLKMGTHLYSAAKTAAPVLGAMARAAPLMIM